MGTRVSGRRATVLAGVWLAVVLVGVVVAATALGALVETRAQREGLARLRQDLSYAEAASRTPLAAADPVPQPVEGGTVGLLQVPRLGLQRVVQEGARPGDTQHGPGHVPGTAGLGQPGNAAVVGRLAGYGGAFGSLGQLRRGDEVLVTTVQGQSVYRVTGVERATARDALAPTPDDRLSLVTASGAAPWSWSRATVVTAALVGKPYAPTIQGARSAVSDGPHGDPSALATVVVWAALLGLTAASAAVLYRRWLVRSTWLLTSGALVALVVLLSDASTRLLPAWV